MAHPRHYPFIVLLATSLEDLKRRSGVAARGALRCLRFAFDSLHRRFPHKHERILEPFRAQQELDLAAYEALFRYFLEGWLTYRLPTGSGARYPGMRSWSGVAVDDLEGFSRSAPLWAAWVSGGRPAIIKTDGGENVDLVDLFTSGLRSGTDPKHPGYWGPMTGPSDQRVVEAADIALALWLFGERAWRRLSAAEQMRVMDWFSMAHSLPGLQNNWHLFFVLIDRVQRAFGHPGANVEDVRLRFRRIRSFHIGDGWFEDGPGGHVDFYNAWGFQYALHWIDRIDPEWAPEFIHTVMRDFAQGYRYLIGPKGIPILGRSIPYRIAASAPLLFVQSRWPEVVAPGEAKRALDVTWSHFIRHGAVRRGSVTQGYYGADPRVLDNYSGPASPLWSLRSLVAAFHLPPKSPLWRAAPEPLPVERDDYQVRLEAPRWRVSGEASTGRITVEVEDNAGNEPGELEMYGLADRLVAADRRWPRRPENKKAKYERPCYSSSGPDSLIDRKRSSVFRSIASYCFPY